MIMRFLFLFLFFGPLMWITLIDFQILSRTCILEINPIWPWHMIIFIRVLLNYLC